MNSLTSKYQLVWSGSLNGVPSVMPNTMVSHDEESLYNWLNHYVNSGWVVDTLEVSEIG
jgi:hypothetical protein